MIVPDPLTRNRNKAVVLGIPLSWNKNKERKYTEMMAVSNVPSHYHITYALSYLSCTSTRVVIKEYGCIGLITQYTGFDNENLLKQAM